MIKSPFTGFLWMEIFYFLFYTCCRSAYIINNVYIIFSLI